MPTYIQPHQKPPIRAGKITSCSRSYLPPSLLPQPLVGKGKAKIIPSRKQRGKAGEMWGGMRGSWLERGKGGGFYPPSTSQLSARRATQTYKLSNKLIEIQYLAFWLYTLLWFFIFWQAISEKEIERDSWTYQQKQLPSFSSDSGDR